MSGDEEREKRKKYNSFIRSKYADEWKQTYRIEKDSVNLHQLHDVEGYQSTACQILDKSNAELLKIQSQAFYETPENVKSKDKDNGTREKECATGCTGACSVVTGHSLKNCQETIVEVSTSEREDNGRYRYPTREEKLEALWIKENGNVVKDHVHSSPGLPLVRQLVNMLRQTLLLCSVSDETCGRPLFHVNNESDLAVIIMKGLKELAFKDDQSAIDKLQQILKESLAICYEMAQGGDGEESSDDTLQFLKALLDAVVCMGRQRNNKIYENHNNLQNRRPVLPVVNNNLMCKTNNIEILHKLSNSGILELTSEKSGREDLTALQLEFKKEERDASGILSALAIKEESLKEMKVFPHQLYETKVATTTGGELYEREGQGKKRKKMKLSRVTREIRARMKRRTELEREKWTKEESSDDN